MTERTCLNCRFSDPQAPHGRRATLCLWLTADGEGGDYIPEWAHDFLIDKLDNPRGAKLVHVGSAETCPAFAMKIEERPAGPLGDMVTKTPPSLACDECGIYPADAPSRLCPGCAAYKEHTQ